MKEAGYCEDAAKKPGHYGAVQPFSLHSDSPAVCCGATDRDQDRLPARSAWTRLPRAATTKAATWIPFLALSALLLVLAASPANAYLAYVSNEKGNSVSVLDTDSMTVVAKIKTGQRPRGIDISPDGKFVFVAVGDDDTIEIIDTIAHKVVGNLPSGEDPEQFAIDPAGALLYVANEDGARVSIIDIAARKRVAEIPVGIEPEGIAVSPDGKTVVCTSETTSMAHFIDTGTHTVTGNLLLGSRPRSAAFKSDGSELWVTSEVGGGLSIIDPATRRIKQVVKFAVQGLRAESIQPVGVNITRDGRLGFVFLGPANRVAVVDGTTHEIIKYLLVGQRAWHGALTPDEKYLLVANGVTNDVSVIDVGSQKVIKSIQVGEMPWGIAVSPK